MDDEMDSRQAEIDRVKAAVNDVARLMNGKFEIDEGKIRAFAAGRPDAVRDGPGHMPIVSRH